MILKMVAYRFEPGTLLDFDDVLFNRVNTYHDMKPGAPFGGYKMSGVGREQ